MDCSPKLRDDLVVVRQESKEGLFFVIKDPRTGRFFRVREPERWIIDRFDGQTTFVEIERGFSEQFGMQLPAEALPAFADKLDSLFFLDTERAEYESSRAFYRTDGAERKSFFSRLLYIKLKAFDPTPFLNAVLRWYRPLHGRALFALSLLFLGAGGAVLVANVSAFVIPLNEIFTLGSIVTVMISLALVILLHELAHAITCRIHGGEVREVGFLLLYFEPCFYTNLSDAWLFERKAHRLAVIWAGPFMQLLTLAAAVFIWRVTVIGSAINEIAQISAVVALVTIVFNFNPLIKLDGYYLLSDWLEIPNLRARAFRFWRSWLTAVFLGAGSSGDDSDSGPRERRVFLWYAALATLYTVALLGYLYTLLWSWVVARWGAPGALLLVAAPVLILRRELFAIVRHFEKPVTVVKNILRSPVRGITYLILLVALALLIFAAPFSDRVSGAVEIQPLRRFTIVTGAGGQIKTELRTGGVRPDVQSGYLNMSSLDLSALDIRVRVSVGDRIQPGDTLLALNSNQVTAELEAARSALATLHSRLALLKSPPKAESLLVLDANAQALESEYRRARSELTRKQELFSKNLIARNELEDAESTVEVTESRWESARSTVALFKSPPKPEEEAVILNDIRKQESAIGFLESQAAAQVITSP
ncbi:MAG TPA: hypothetical protein VLB27_03795, partial [candidate division Zixibacteria bacterium]|nr:hypothetical protein [candidate division Zixibacteria bacterium]